MDGNLPIDASTPCLMYLTPGIPDKPVQVTYLTRDNRQFLRRPYRPLPQLKLLHDRKPLYRY